MEVKKATDIPTEPHLAALVFKTRSINHDGDERSRTNPGHGYPAHTEVIHSVDYIIFKDKGEMEAWVLAAETKREKPNYRLLEAKPLSATLKASVDIR